jgi:hypothetical protein
MKAFRNKIILGIATSVLIVCSGWGFLMHRTITQLSIYQLPPEMQPFFSQNMDYLVKHSIRPDERRNSDRTEATKHFIDLEAYGPDAEKDMPLNWDAAVAKYTKDTLLKYGHVPYWVIEMKNRLTRAFDVEDRDSILFYAADIAHYIEDANVPLSATAFAIHGGTDNATGIPGAFATGIQPFDLRVLQGFIPWYTHRRRGS